MIIHKNLTQNKCNEIKMGAEKIETNFSISLMSSKNEDCQIRPYFVAVLLALQNLNAV